MHQRARVFRMTVATWVCLLAACATPTARPIAAPTPVPIASIAPSNQASSGTNPPSGGVQFLAWGSAAQQQAYEDVVAAYKQRSPADVVELVTMPSQADEEKRLAADFAARTPADVILLSYLDLAALTSKRLLAPVAPLLANSRVITPDNYFAQALGPFTYNRKLQCLPQDISGLVVYYNRNLFEQARLPEPRARWNWDQFLADARALTRDTNGDGEPDQFGLGFEPTLSRLAPFVFENKGALVDDPLFPSELALNTPAVLTATAWLVSLQTQFHVVPDSQAELAASSEQRFAEGTVGMFIGTRGSVPAFRQISSFDWDVAPLPALNGRASNVVFADGYCLTAASSQQAAAWRFIEFAGSSAGQSILAKSGAFIPALVSAAKSADFLNPAARPAHGQAYLDTVSEAQALPLLPNWNDIQAIADEELQQAFYGQKDVAQALTAAVTRSEEYFIIHTAH